MNAKVTMFARLLLVFLVGFVFVGCGENRATIATDTPTPPLTATASLAATPTVSIILTPVSTPAEIGHTYPFQLLTHCGVNYHVDFDQSFWEATVPVWDGAGSPPPGLRNPVQDGTMTLLDTDHARFDYSGGQIPFRRLTEPKVVHGLCG